MDGEQERQEGPQTLDPARSAAVMAELERILNSTAFRTARRSQDFLRYIVANALEGRSELVKERSIGANVFQRAPDYDTGEDSIVRVKASELRKRLAQYYLENGPGAEVTIDLPAGAYRPDFRWREKAEPVPEPSVLEPAPPPAARLKLPPLRYALAGAVLVLLALAVLWGGRAFQSKSALDRFWEPVFSSSRPALLCVANPVVFQARNPTRDVLAQGAAPELIPSGDLIYDPDNYVGVGDAFALARIAGHLGGRGKVVSIRPGNKTSFADLRDHPVVLIGAFTNQWTMQMMADVRFVFDRVDGMPCIRDLGQNRTWKRDPANPQMDYLILSRIFESRSGQMVITAAGLAHAGTQMAGEFLTNPSYFEQAMKNAPADWSRRNMQLVVSGEVIGNTPGPPKLVESWYW